MRSDIPPSSEVIVMGAGIVGLFNAVQLARRGIAVLLVDDLTGERSYKVGESLLWFTSPFLQLGTDLPPTLCTQQAKTGIWFVAGMEGKQDFATATEWALTIKNPGPFPSTPPEGIDLVIESLLHDRQLVRPEVELALLAEARRRGVVVVDDARVFDATLGEGGADLHVVKWRHRDGTTGEARCRWVIDCSGRRRLLARKLRLDQPFEDDFQTDAAWAQFRLRRPFPETWRYDFPKGGAAPRSGATTHIWGDGYWIWVIPLCQDRLSLGVTYAQHRTPPGKDYRERFWDVMNRYPVLKDVLADAEMLEFQSYKNVQYQTKTSVSPRRFGIFGDAATLIDAYYSQGMAMSFKNSWHCHNLIEEDLRQGRLDLEYLKHVDDGARQDFLVHRATVRWKFEFAARDSRFFIHSHQVDLAMFTAAAAGRLALALLLSETKGTSQPKTLAQKALKAFLRKFLFLSQPFPFGLVATPEQFRRGFDWLQRALAAQAGQRAEEGRAASEPRRTILSHPPYQKIPTWLLLMLGPVVPYGLIVNFGVRVLRGWDGPWRTDLRTAESLPRADEVLGNQRRAKRGDGVVYSSNALSPDHPSLSSAS